MRVLGFDATFCAPKSVSVLYALGSPAVSAEVASAHDAAVRAALTAYEDEACRARRGHPGAVVAEAEGFVGAAFGHRTSRSGDPHLHTLGGRLERPAGGDVSSSTAGPNAVA